MRGGRKGENNVVGGRKVTAGPGRVEKNIEETRRKHEKAVAARGALALDRKSVV